MEDIPTIETLNLTAVKYTEAMNYLDRQTPPEFLKCEFEIDNCKASELNLLAEEIGVEIVYSNGIILLEIIKPGYTLKLWGEALKG